jgi:hypothetical protein
MRSSLLCVPACFFFLLTCACSSVLSEDVPTGEINATFRVTAGPGTTTASAVFLRNGSFAEYVDLSGNDYVTCNGKKLARDSFFGAVTYDTAVEYQVDSDYIFELHRAEGTSLSSVTLPESITISAPLSGSVFSQGNPIPVQWNVGTTAGDLITVDFGPYESGELSSLLAGHTIPGSSTGTTNTESRTLAVSRIRLGTLSSDFHGGSIKALQQHKVQITLEY